MIQKLLLLLLLLQMEILASHYNSTILELEAKLFPKMLFLSDNLKKEASRVHICIVSKERELHNAENFKKAIEHNYRNGIMGKSIFVSIATLETIRNYPDAVIILYHSEKELRRVANWANNNKVLSFSYEPSYLEFGVLASIYIGVSTKPYLNKTVIKRFKFGFNPYLLELSKFR